MSGDNSGSVPAETSHQTATDIPDYSYYTEQAASERRVAADFVERVVNSGVELSEEQRQILGNVFQSFVIGHVQQIVRVYT